MCVLAPAFEGVFNVRVDKALIPLADTNKGKNSEHYIWVQLKAGSDQKDWYSIPERALYDGGSYPL